MMVRFSFAWETADRHSRIDAKILFIIFCSRSWSRTRRLAHLELRERLHQAAAVGGAHGAHEGLHELAGGLLVAGLAHEQALRESAGEALRVEAERPPDRSSRLFAIALHYRDDREPAVRLGEIPIELERLRQARFRGEGV